MKVTGKNLLFSYRDLCRANNKIFLSTHEDDEHADQISRYFNKNHYSWEFLLECMEYELQNSDIVSHTLFNFGLKLREIMGDILERRADREDFHDLLEKTRARMNDTRGDQDQS